MLEKNPSQNLSGAGRRLRRAFLAALAPLLLVSIAQAQETGSIAGRVGPRHDHDLLLATAHIPDLGLKVEVAADGSFRFDQVRPGRYLLEVRVPTLGVALEQVEVRAGAETAVEVVIKPGSHSEEIVVTAAAEARDPLDLATATTSLSGQELALRLESSLGETLAGEPGISSTFFGPGASRPVIRGLTGDRVRVLEGGLGTGDASGVSADHAVTADPAQAERIEVLRGPATLLYGSSAIGGAVNVIDERIPSSRATAAVSGSAELRGGSVDDQRGGSLALDGGAGDWAWHVDAAGHSSDDYRVPGSTIANSDLETRGGRLGVSTFFGDRGFLGVAVSGFDTEYGLPGGIGPGEEGGGDDGQHGEESVRIDMRQRRLDLRSELRRPFAGFQALRFRLGATDYQHVELEDGETGTEFFNDFLEARLELVQQRRQGAGGRLHTGSIGLQALDRELEAVGEEAFLPKTATGQLALFTLQELEAGALRWQLGARFERQQADPVSDSLGARAHHGLSASLGLVWQAGGAVSLAASVARSVKLPAPEELYANGLHAATQAFEIGDPDLGEEVGLGVDLSLRLESGPVSGEVTVFRQDFDDFIFQAFTGDVAEGFPVVRYRQQDATLTGAELEARIELYEHDRHHLHLRLVGDLVDARLDAGERLPRIPPLRLGASLHYHSERFNASAEVRWVDRQRDLAVNETATAGYTLVNASCGYRILLRNQIVDLLLRGRNLGDEVARSHTSFLKDVVPLPGRDFGVAVKLRF